MTDASATPTDPIVNLVDTWFANHDVFQNLEGDDEIMVTYDELIEFGREAEVARGADMIRQQM